MNLNRRVKASRTLGQNHYEKRWKRMGEGFGTLMTEIWSGIGSVVSTITAQPLLLIPVGASFAGILIGLARTLMKGKRK